MKVFFPTEEEVALRVAKVFFVTYNQYGLEWESHFASILKPKFGRLWRYEVSLCVELSWHKGKIAENDDYSLRDAS